MSLSPRKLCLRYWSVLLEQWGGAPSCWNTTMFISMPLFLLNATAKLSETSPRCTVLRCQSHDLHHYLQKKYNLKIPPLPIAYHTVTFYWLNGCWVCLWGCWDGQNLMFYLLTCPLRWKWASSLNRIKPRSLGLFSILPLLSFLFASVCFWTICTLYGNNFKSL